MNLNDFLGSGYPQNAPEYRKSHLPNSKSSVGVPPDTQSMTTPHQQLPSPATTDTDIYLHIICSYVVASLISGFGEGRSHVAL